MQGKWLLAGGVAIFAAVAAGAVAWFRAQQQPKPAAQPPAAAQAAVPAGDEFSGEGKIQAIHIVPVKAPVDGVVEELFAEIGAEVYEGQLLARIRNGKFDMALETATADAEKVKTRVNSLEGSIIAARLEASRAEAEAARVREALEKAERAFQRQQMLLREGATPRLTFEKAEKDFEQAKADAEAQLGAAKSAADRVESLQKDIDLIRRQLDEKNADLEDAQKQASAGEVHSPVDGVVIARKASAGESANPALEDFIQIAVKLNELQVALDPPPPVLAKVKVGQQAMVRVAESNEELPAKVREVKAGQVFVEFSSPNPAAIKPGLTALVRIKLI